MNDSTMQRKQSCPNPNTSSMTATNNQPRRHTVPLPNQQQQQQQQSQSKPAQQTRSRTVVEHSSSMSKCGYLQTNFSIGGTKFTVHQKYKLLRAIGHGAYGFVCSAENAQTKEFVAIKKITNLFNNPIETKRAIREVQLLRKLRHENILGLIDLMMNDERTDLYLVSELMDSDLHQIIVSKQTLSNDHIQYFIYQILRGLLFIHSANVIHRDLKPSNILVNSNCDIKICDFGLARPVDAEVQDHKAFMTEYVATRWYRAPEIMLSWKQYSFAIDIWATGCILAELLGRMPLFPGKDYMDQLKRTLNYIGKPSGSEISHIRTERARQWVRNFPPTPRVDWRHLYPDADLKSIDLLDKMLQFSPSKRISVQNALKHKYLGQLHDASDEPIANFKFDMKFEQEFKDNTMEIAKSKTVLERELNWFQEFQSQRTKYILHVRSNQSPSSHSNVSSAAGTRSGTNTPSRSSMDSSVKIEQQQRMNQFHAQMMQQQMPTIQNHDNGNGNMTQGIMNTNIGMTQDEIAESQRMNAYQAQMMQSQMMQQRQFEQRRRSQSYPLLPSYQHNDVGNGNNNNNVLHHSNSFGNNPIHQQQQQGFVNSNNQQQYIQHQQYLQHQQQFQQIQQVQTQQMMQGGNEQTLNHSQSMNMD